MFGIEHEILQSDDLALQRSMQCSDWLLLSFKFSHATTNQSETPHGFLMTYVNRRVLRDSKKPVYANCSLRFGADITAACP